MISGTEVIRWVLLASVLVFVTGLALIITRRHVLAVLVGIELLFIAANLNFVTFNRFVHEDHQGHIMALMITVVAVCEAALGLAILMVAYRHYHTVIVDEINQLKG